MMRALALALCLLGLGGAVGAQQVNHLEGAQSPYLLQHLHNPVDWYRWGPEALQKARDENKPIFVSVGYSSCHWCHVMRHESFEDAAIADVLNRHFVSIKIDREIRPDLDERFMLVTQLMVGGGGWPNSVFLTPKGDPYFAGGYFPPADFLPLLKEIAQIWRDDPANTDSQARMITRIIDDYMARTAQAREITPDLVRHEARTLLDGIDPFNGGFGVAPKFPREPVFLFLLDQARRDGDTQMLTAVTDMLDAMIKGGIHDHVGGGFHRYAVDPEWHVPHFEKMLYTQAMTGRLLIRAWADTGRLHYQRSAVRLLDYVLRDMRGEHGGFYSAQDADSVATDGQRVEGAYYTWTPAQLEPLGQTATRIANLFQVSPEGELNGANVLHLRASPAELAKDAGDDPAAFTRKLDEALADMLALRNTRSAPFLDRKIVLSWNGAMIETLAEASTALNRPDYYRAAEQAVQFTLQNMQGADGLARIWYDGTANVPAQLGDVAALGLALVALHDHAPDRATAAGWLQQARALANDMRRTFGPIESGLHMVAPGQGISPVIPLNDGDLPSGNAMALALLSRLSQRMQAPDIERDAHLLAAALSGHAMNAPEQRGQTLKALQDLHFGESGPLRHVAKGAVRVRAHQAGSGSGGEEESEDALIIDIAEGWHINAHEPLEAYFVPTRVTGQDGADIALDYPEPALKTLTFNDAPLALYEGKIRLHLPSDRPRQVTLTLQACSDDICLQPEELHFVYR